MASSVGCAECNDPLIVVVKTSDDDEDLADVSGPSNTAVKVNNTVPDDVHLQCGCHFHWQCLMETVTSSQCPACSKELTTEGPAGPQMLCNLHNEGGQQDGLDLLPTLVEEAYCNAHPQERKARAFLEYCRNGDLPAIVEMLQSQDDDEDQEADAVPPMPDADLLRYQDPTGKKYSGLHAAIEGKSREVVWLLLLLASSLDLQKFPAEVFQEAGVMGIMRDDADVESGTDIRTFVDAEGRSAEQLAAQIGVPFRDWIGHGLLSI